MAKVSNNKLESVNPLTDDLILKGKDIKLEGANVTLNGSPFGGGGAGGNYVVFDPDIAVSDGPRKKTWAEVVVALAALPAAVSKTLWLHKVTPIPFTSMPVPVGTYDLSGVDLRGTPESLIPTLDFADGCVLSGMPTRISGCQVKNNNTTAPLHEVPASKLMFLFMELGALFNGTSATMPAIRVAAASGGATIILNSHSISPLYKQGASAEVIEIETGKTLSIDVLLIQNNGFAVLNDLFMGAGNVTINMYSVIDKYVGTHALLSGNLVVNDFSDQQIRENFDFPIRIGSGSAIIDNFSIVIGVNAEENGVGRYGNVVLGPYANAYGDESVAIGDSAGTTAINNDGTVYVGYGAYGSGQYTIGIGHTAFTGVGADGAISIGHLASNTGVAAVAIGENAVISAAGDYGVAIGNGASVSALYGIAIGYNAVSLSDNSVALGRGLTADIPDTTVMRPVIHTAYAGATDFGKSNGAESVLFTAEFDMLQAANTYAEIVIPSGSRFYCDEVGVITTAVSGFVSAGDLKFGHSGNDSIMAPTFTVGSAVFDKAKTVSAFPNGTGTLRVTIVTPAVATGLTVRPYFKGVLVKN